MTSQSSTYSQGKIDASGSHDSQQSRERSYISPSEVRNEHSMTAQSSTISPMQVNTNGYHYSHQPRERFQNHPDAEDADYTPIPLHHAIWMPYQPMHVDASRNHIMHPIQSAPFDAAPSYNPPAPSGYVPPFYHVHPYEQSRPTALNYRSEFNYTPTGNNYERNFNVIHSSPNFAPRNDSPTPPLPPPSPPVPSPPPSPSSIDDGNTGLIESNSITADDVLCGRGAGANTHPGNVKFRTLIAEYQPLYLFNKPLFKTNIAKRIVAEITGNGGRFLKLSDQASPNGKKNLWYNIGFKAAREKTCQALRERAASSFDIRDGDTENDHSKTVVVACDTIEVNDDDVLMGRGGVTNGHPGNQKFREIVKKRQVEYLTAPKLKKAGIATLVIEEVFSGGGRFLMDKKGRWVEISKEKARAKTSQALREKAPELQTIVDAAHELIAKRQGDASSDCTSDHISEAPRL